MARMERSREESGRATAREEDPFRPTAAVLDAGHALHESGWREPPEATLGSLVSETLRVVGTGFPVFLVALLVPELVNQALATVPAFFVHDLSRLADARLFVGAAILLVAVPVSLAVQAGVTRYAHRAAESIGLRANPREVLSVRPRHVARLLAINLALGIAVATTLALSMLAWHAIHPAAAVVPAAFGGWASAWLAARWFVFSPLVASRDLTARSACRRSAELTRRKRWLFFGLAVATYGIVLGGGFAAARFGPGLAGEGAEPLASAAVVSVLLTGAHVVAYAFAYALPAVALRALEGRDDLALGGSAFPTKDTVSR